MATVGRPGGHGEAGAAPEAGRGRGDAGRGGQALQQLGGARPAGGLWQPGGPGLGLSVRYQPT